MTRNEKKTAIENMAESLDNAYEISVDESNLVKENTKAAENKAGGTQGKD